MRCVTACWRAARMNRNIPIRKISGERMGRRLACRYYSASATYRLRNGNSMPPGATSVRQSLNQLIWFKELQLASLYVLASTQTKLEKE